MGAVLARGPALRGWARASVPTAGLRQPGVTRSAGALMDVGGGACARAVDKVHQAAQRSADRSAQRLKPRRRWAAPASRWAAWPFGWGEWGRCPQTPGAGGPSRAGGHGSPGVGRRLRSKAGALFAPASRGAAPVAHDGASSWPHVIARQNRSLEGRPGGGSAPAGRGAAPPLCGRGRQACTSVLSRGHWQPRPCAGGRGGGPGGRLG